MTDFFRKTVTAEKILDYLFAKYINAIDFLVTLMTDFYMNMVEILKNRVFYVYIE
jgi:hypothetical protein